MSLLYSSKAILMFDSLIKEVATRLHLNEERALPVVQLVLAYITNKDAGGVTGFVQKFKDAGLGSIIQSWVGSDAAHAHEISEGQVQQVLGGPTGLLRLLTSRFGFNSQVGSSMLAFLMPRLIGSLATNGSLPSVVPSEIASFVGDARNWLTATAGGAIGYSTQATKAVSAKPTGNSLMKWLPVLLLAGVVVFLLSYCGKKPVVVQASPSAAAAATNTTGVAAASDSTPAFPTGAGVLLAMIDGTPALKVYFENGKDGVSPEFAERAKPLADYLKEHSEVKAAISGYNDATGDAAINAELSKRRAQAVADALKALGAPESSMVLEKPLNPIGTGDTNAESRRVEVILRK